MENLRKYEGEYSDLINKIGTNLVAHEFYVILRKNGVGLLIPWESIQGIEDDLRDMLEEISEW